MAKLRVRSKQVFLCVCVRERETDGRKKYEFPPKEKSFLISFFLLSDRSKVSGEKERRKASLDSFSQELQQEE